MRTTILALTFILALAFINKSHADEIDWTKVDVALGKTASVQGDVHRYGIPRSDLQVTLDGVSIKPALAHPVPPDSSCPALCRASTRNQLRESKTWMAGTSPAMTEIAEGEEARLQPSP